MRIFITTLSDNENKLSRELSLLKTSLLYSNEKVILYSNDFTENCMPLFSIDDDIRLAFEAQMKRLISYDCRFCLCEKKCKKKCIKFDNYKSLKKTIDEVTEEYSDIYLEIISSCFYGNNSYNKEIQEKMVKFFHDKRRAEIIDTLGYSSMYDFDIRITKKEKAINVGLTSIDGGKEADLASLKTVNALFEIYYAIKAGLVSEYPFAGMGDDSIVPEFAGHLLNQTGVIGALDERLVNKQSEDADIQQHDKKIVDIAGRIFSKLPNFENATIAEIIDIRKEIEKYTQNFQSSLVKLSTNIKTAVWDKSFVRDVEDSIIQYVLPSINEIEEAVKTNKSFFKYFPDTINAIKSTTPLLSTSVVGAVLVNYVGLPMSSNAVLCGCGAAMTVGALAADIHNKKKEAKSQIENNGFYLVYKVKEKLKKISGGR